MTASRVPVKQISAIWAAVFVFVCGLAAQSGSSKKPATPSQKRAQPARVSLSPRFSPGDSFRYQMEFETTTETKRSGVAKDPEGPSSLVVDWTATARIDVLPGESASGAGAVSGIRLRTTYEKSSATVQSDTFDPAAEETSAQYRQLEGKVIELALDTSGQVKSVTGIEGMADSEKAALSAREWLAQLSASSGAPPGGVAIGQMWSSEQPADTLPLAGLVWHTDSQYLRNEPCHPPNPELGAPTSDLAAGASVGANASSTSSQAGPADCAVILANLSLVKAKSAPRDATPADLRRNGVESSGRWNGSAQSLLYVSLASGLVVSATQTGTEEMDVTLTSFHNTTMRYAGTISSRSHVSLVSGAAGRQSSGDAAAPRQ